LCISVDFSELRKYVHQIMAFNMTTLVEQFDLTRKYVLMCNARVSERFGNG